MSVKCVGKYKFNTKDKLGNGCFGVVYKGCKKEDEAFVVAIKVLKKTEESENELKAVQKLKDNPHDNIVRFYDYYKFPDQLVLVMEYCNGGTLAAYKKDIDDETLWIFTKQLANAVKHFHSLGIYHGDLKPDNILLNYSAATLTLKIADFGWAKHLEFENPSPWPESSDEANEAENYFFNFVMPTDTIILGRIIKSLVEGQPPSNLPVRSKLLKIIEGLQNKDASKRMTSKEACRELSPQPNDDEQSNDNKYGQAASLFWVLSCIVIISFWVVYMVYKKRPVAALSLVLLGIVLAVIYFIFFKRKATEDLRVRKRGTGPARSAKTRF